MKKKITENDILNQIDADIINNPSCLQPFPIDLLERALRLINSIPEIDVDAPIE